VADNWIQENSISLKESSLVKYKNMLRLYILPVLGECRIDEITNNKVSAMCNDLLANGGRKGKGDVKRGWKEERLEQKNGMSF